MVNTDTDTDTGIATVFTHGRNPAVQLPDEFRLKGGRVRVRRVEGGLLLQPIYTNFDEWVAELRRYSDVPFMEEGREQPPMPDDDEELTF